MALANGPLRRHGASKQRLSALPSTATRAQSWLRKVEKTDVAMDESAHRLVRVVDCVDLSLGDVMAVFDRPQIDEMLEATMVDATGADPAPLRLHVHADRPERLTAYAARVRVTWRAIRASEPRHEGGASLVLRVLQSGSEPMTELVITHEVQSDTARETANTMRRALEALTDRLKKTAA